ncbi:MAG: 5'/3'-nucleotidase SurE [Anaerolineae bacterium]
MAKRPLILLSNDDGILSPGLLAVARAVAPLAQLLVAAPARQRSGWSRAMPADVGHVERVALDVPGSVEAWSVDASPAMAVRWALSTRVASPPDLAITGINYGENLGVSIPISGTLGAACEAASFGPPAIAASLETDAEHFRTISDEVDFSVAADITARIARSILASGLPSHVDVLNVNVPRGANAGTAWRWTRVSRHHYFESVVEVRGGERHIVGWRTAADPDVIEPDSDIRALALDQLVSVSPVTIDPTAHSGLVSGDGQARLDGRGQIGGGQDGGAQDNRHLTAQASGGRQFVHPHYDGQVWLDSCP